MANMELIQTQTVGAGGTSSITFSSLTSNYTDLKLICSTRNSSGDVGIWIRFNGDSAQSYTWKMIWAGGSGNLGSYSQTVGTNYDRSFFAYAEPNTYTSGIFSNVEIYIPNYQSTTAKSISIDAVGETNDSTAYRSLTSGVYSTSSPVSSITILPENGTANLMEGSTFYLYGISNVTSSPKATGGIISQDATYWYHTFPFSSTFTPTQALSADILCIAGGGGGGWGTGTGGGGAGGLRGLTSQSLTTTAYTVTVGAGGPSTYQQSSPSSNKGGNSSFAGSGFTTITATGGGGGGSNYNSGNSYGGTGGSGGGGGGRNASGTAQLGGSGNEGSYSPVEGYAGGQRTGDYNYYYGGGGGGATAVGTNASNGTTAGSGGAGSSAYSSWGLATFTGQIVGGTAYFAGGGGGGSAAPSGIQGTGGVGGGGNGGVSSVRGLVNTGSGGGGHGGYEQEGAGGAGGSGIVILRYAK